MHPRGTWRRELIHLEELIKQEKQRLKEIDDKLQKITIFLSSTFVAGGLAIKFIPESSLPLHFYTPVMVALAISVLSFFEYNDWIQRFRTKTTSGHWSGLPENHISGWC